MSKLPGNDCGTAGQQIGTMPWPNRRLAVKQVAGAMDTYDLDQVLPEDKRRLIRELIEEVNHQRNLFTTEPALGRA